MNFLKLQISCKTLFLQSACKEHLACRIFYLPVLTTFSGINNPTWRDMYQMYQFYDIHTNASFQLDIAWFDLSEDYFWYCHNPICHIAMIVILTYCHTMFISMTHSRFMVFYLRIAFPIDQTLFIIVIFLHFIA